MAAVRAKAEAMVAQTAAVQLLVKAVRAVVVLVVVVAVRVAAARARAAVVLVVVVTAGWRRRG